MAAALLCLLIPGRFTRSFKNPFHLLAGMPWGVRATALRAGESVESQIRPAVPAERFEAAQRERAALEHQVVALDTQVKDLREQIAAISGWRERGLLADVRLLAARVCAGDAAGWRQSILIDRGHSDGVEVGDWVVSHAHFEADATGKVAPGELLVHECLLGQIAETSPLTSQVVLLTDSHRRTPTRVRIGRIEEGRLVGPEQDFVLYGQGQEKMSVPDVPAQLQRTGKVRAGDLVISSPALPRLPVSMVIGQVERIEPDEKNPLLAHLFVKPRLNARLAQRVYVVGAPATK